MQYLKQFGIIIGISFVAELLKSLIPLLVPAGIYGMVILFLLLSTKMIKLEQVSDVGNFLISVMGIMFVPAGVGIMRDYNIIIEMLPAMVIAVIVITVIVMVMSGRVTQLLLKKDKKKWK